MRRPFALPASPTVFIGAMLVLASCASPSVSTEESTGSEPTSPPTESSEPEESQGGGGAETSPSPAGGSTGDAPALADGPWTGGHGAVTVGGGLEWATDEPITTDVSETLEAKTILGYNSDDTYVTVMINLTGVPFHAAVDAPDFSVSGEDCDVTYTRADDTGIEGSFSCVANEIHSFTGEEPSGEVTIEGTFTASR